MKRTQQSALIASLLALALGACSSTDSMRTANPVADSEASRSGEAAQDISQDISRNRAAGNNANATGSSGNTMGASGSANDKPGGTAMTPSGTSEQAGYGRSETTLMPNSTVTAIEVIPRQSADVGTGSMAGAAVGGSTGSASDQVYRITLSMDDGSTKVLTQESSPTFKNGERVRVANGMIQPQPQSQH
ncbi:MAG: hypothetical protein V4582_21340 [Pseudomonadota bacterium]